MMKPEEIVGYKRSRRGVTPIEYAQRINDALEGEKYTFLGFGIDDVSQWTIPREIMVVFECPEHGISSTVCINNFLGKGRRCPECGKNKRALNRTIPKEEFIESCKKVHPLNSYDNIVYTKQRGTVYGIVCTEHNETFSMNGWVHKTGMNGCTQCKHTKK